MRILVLGGTQYLGRHFVEIAHGRGHTLTLFNRGKTNTDLFADIERLHGDRMAGDLAALDHREWDAVFDTCGYVPRVVRQSAEMLAPRVGHYTFVSTLSVYATFGAGDESAALATLADPTTEAITGETYGGLKVLCEQAAEAAMPGRVFVPRPGLIVGPNDPTDRFTHWPVRVAAGGEVLAPGDENRRVQVIDVRDLAGWILDKIEQSTTGAFNATGPEQPPTMGDLLATCREVAGSDARLVWVGDTFLESKGVAPYSEMPLWIPGAHDAFDCSKAYAAGLACRPIADTVRDTLAWATTRPADHTWRAGLSREREAELLRDWHAAQEPDSDR